MIFEVLIVAAAIAIFVILARRLPETNFEIHEPQETSEAKTGSKFSLQGVIKTVGTLAGKIKRPGFGMTKSSSADVPVALTVEDLIRESDNLMEAGDLKSAEKLSLKAATRDPENPKIYNRLGVIYLQLRNFADARDAFLATLKIDDRIASRHYNLGLAYIGLGRKEKAKVALKRAIELDPSKNKYQKTLEEIEIG